MFRVTLAACAGVLMSVSAIAQQHAAPPPPGFPTQVTPPQMMKTCRQDTAKFCSNVSLGGQPLLACLQSHNSDLSDKCQKAVTAAAKAKPVTDNDDSDD